MAYSLYFWREEKPLDLTPDEIAQQVSEDLTVEGLAILPLDEVKQKFAETFPGLDDGLSGLSWEGAGSYFEVSWPPDPVNALIVTCGYKLLKSPDTMNQIIDVAHFFGCPLYDPQTGERYSLPEDSGS